MFERIEKLLESHASLADECVGGVTPFDLQLATAVCLVAAAKADHIVTPQERELVIKALSRQFHLPVAEAAYTLGIAVALLKDAEKLAAFAELVRRHFPLQQRLMLAAHAWKIVTSDKTLTEDEAQLIETIRAKLGLTDDNLAAAKTLVSGKKV